jgi:peroxiredoxin/mono/diheme cytochrome c family protein
MNHPVTLWIVGWASFALIAGSAVAAEQGAPATIRMGDRIANFEFKDIRHAAHSLADLPKSKALVLAFTNADCPLVKRYFPVLKRLEQEYRERGVQFVAVNVGADDSIGEMASQAIEYDVPFHFVKDFTGDVARQLGVRRTPEVAVLDADRQLRYRGRIDDQYRLGGLRAQATRPDLQAALDDLLAGREVAVPETPVEGCLITAAPAAPATGPAATYAEHVAPLMQKHCVECHRPGMTAPFPLTTYEHAAAHADTIAEVVREQRMPPWFASPAHGTFINRRGMTPQERATIGRWVAQGTPVGDETLLSPSAPPANEREWLIGKPDLIVKSLEYEIPAEGDIPYRHAVLPHLFLADTWVQAVQIRSDNPRVLHHGNMAYVTLGEEFDETNLITGTVPGGEPMRVDEGIALRIPQGSVLALQLHFVSTGKPEKCRVSVGIKYARGVVQKRLRFKLLADYRFAIPPGAAAHPVAASQILECDAVGVGLFSHMHVRGKDMTFRAHRPQAEPETLLLIPNYNFDWQMPYRWEPGKVRFPKGTRLEAIAHYDNSALNPFNPDPTATVRNGPQTYHEMMNGYVFYLDEAEQLNLEIDGGTGRGLPRTAPKE